MQEEILSNQAQESDTRADADLAQAAAEGAERTLEGAAEAGGIRIRFNHEDRLVTPEEAAVLAQKGLAYDKLEQRLENIEADPSRAVLKLLAQRSGVETDELIRALEEELGRGPSDGAEDGISDAARAEDGGAATQFAAAGGGETGGEAGALAELERLRAERERERALDRDIERLVGQFGPVDLDSLPDEVWRQVEGGSSLTDAYARYELRRMKADEAARSAEREAEKSAPPAPAGSGAERDFFTDGELDSLTERDLDDPGILARAIKSLTRRR